MFVTRGNLNEPLRSVYGLHYRLDMFLCGHCEQFTAGKMYRVKTEEDGLTLLDMVVCYLCQHQARTLGLRPTEIKLDHKSGNRRPRSMRSDAVAPLYSVNET